MFLYKFKFVVAVVVVVAVERVTVEMDSTERVRLVFCKNLDINIVTLISECDK